MFTDIETVFTESKATLLKVRDKTQMRTTLRLALEASSWKKDSSRLLVVEAGKRVDRLGARGSLCTKDGWDLLDTMNTSKC